MRAQQRLDVGVLVIERGTYCGAEPGDSVDVSAVLDEQLGDLEVAVQGRQKGGVVLWLPRASTEASRLSSSWTTATCPSRLATWSEVAPAVVRSSTAAPRLSSSWTTAAWPLWLAP